MSKANGDGLWDDMLREFRSLGGTAENICLKEGKYGRGLFPIDASKPVQIRIPDTMLVEHKFAQFRDGEFRLAEDTPIGPREREFLENYERDFSWPVGKREIENTFEIIQEAPPKLRELLRKAYYAFRWTVEPTEEIVQQRFIETRVINYKGRDVIMPIVELANHGHETQYQLEDGVGISGTFPNEILVRYQLCDPLQIFGKWGFASGSEYIALSIHVKSEAAEFFIERADPSPKTEIKPFMPAVSVEGRKVKLPYLLLGHRQQPALPRGIFLRRMRDAGRLRDEADALLDSILHINRMHMLHLISACADAPPRVARLLRDVACFQLECMSHCIGRSEL